MRLKLALRFISWLYGAMMTLWKYFALLEPRGSLANDIPCCRASQSRGSTRRSPFTTRVKRIVISVYLNSVCYLISYTRLFMKLNLFEILLYVTFLTTKFSRSTVLGKNCSIKVYTTNDFKLYWLNWKENNHLVGCTI